jgi:hypothetical protein
MRLFKKNIATGAGDKAAGWIANTILRVQRCFADVLEKKSMSWKTKQQWIFLYMVCLLFGGLSVITIVKSFNKKSQNILSKPAAIKTPRMMPDENRNSVVITDNEIRKVHIFKHTLDSLSKTDDGKIKVKNLMMRRPGIMDSLEMVEQLYYSQKK